MGCEIVVSLCCSCSESDEGTEVLSSVCAVKAFAQVRMD